MKIIKKFLILFLLNINFVVFSQEFEQEEQDFEQDEQVQESIEQDINQDNIIKEEITEDNTGETVEPEGQEEQEDYFENANLEEDFLNLESEEPDDILDNNKNLEEKDKTKKESEQKQLAFKKFLEKYYPKVFLICEKFFYFMTPQDIAKSLQDISNMINQNPYLYFEFLFKEIEKKLTEQEKIEWKKNSFDLKTLKSIFNNKSLNKWIKNGGGYYKIIADQLAYYNYFIENCYVDLTDNSVDINLPSDYDFYFLYSIEKKDSTKIKLRDYWAKNGVTSVYDFYALCFDFWVKLFLNAILEKNRARASSYLFDLKTLTDKLTGSVYESERRENLKIYEQLFDILKQEKKMNSNKPASSDSKYMQEFEDLWDF